MSDRRFDRARPDGQERSDLWEGFGARLRDAREAAGLTREQLARRAGCHPTTVKRLELGTRRPRTSMIDSLARILAPAPGEGRDLADDLRQLAGRSLTPDTRTSQRYRATRVRRSQRAEDVRKAREEVVARIDAVRARRPPPPERTTPQALPRDVAEWPPERLPTVRALVDWAKRQPPEKMAAPLPRLIEQLRQQRTAAGLDPDG